MDCRGARGIRVRLEVEEVDCRIILFLRVTYLLAVVSRLLLAIGLLVVAIQGFFFLQAMICARELILPIGGKDVGYSIILYRYHTRVQV